MNRLWGNKVWLAAGAVCLAAGSAVADSSFDFNFSTNAASTITQPIGAPVGYTAGSNLYNSIVFTDPDSGLQVDVTAGVVLPVGFNGSTEETVEASRVGQYYGGLGASHIYGDGQHTVDEYYRDFLILDFGTTEVNIDEIRFRYFSPIANNGTSLADVQVFRDEINASNLIGEGTIPYNPGYDDHGVLSFDPGLSGNIFVITPRNDGIGRHGRYNDQFKLYGVSGHITVVPTPSAAIGGVALLGLLGGGLKRRRRRD